MSSRSISTVIQARPSCSFTAPELAKTLLAEEWQLSLADRTWLSVLSCRFKVEGWHTVELGVYGCPDSWFIQVYNTGECDPCYSFRSPLVGAAAQEHLNVMPDAIAQMLLAERNNLAIPHLAG